MDIRKELSDFKSQLDHELGMYLDRVIHEARKRDPFIANALGYVKTLALSGGKRVRAAYMYHGYRAAGGTDFSRILRASVSIELIHLFLLIHDDIVDRDVMRHGVNSAQEHFRHIGEKLSLTADSVHFGNSMAIIVGDMIGALGNQIIFESGFDSKLILKALAKLQEVVSLTVAGEAQDILIEYRGHATEAEILSMYENKTARYTIDGPLELGTILAGGSKDLASALSAYAVPVGIAFQIQDDILGIFGNRERIGKPIGSDIEEGKITLLVLKSLERASTSQCDEIHDILRKGESLTVENIERFREILVSTGGLDVTKQLAIQYIQQGIDALSEIECDVNAKEFFRGIADYMMTRDY